jgi:hypothetical protein
MIETNKLAHRLENEVIYKVFSANVPMGVYDEQFKIVDSFCKEHFMDNRWSMIWNLVLDASEDYKYKLLLDRIIQLESEVAELKTTPKELEQKKPKTWGRKDERI